MKLKTLSTLSLLILTACISLTDFDESLYPWAERWLDSTSCAAPCWEGIIPGQTTLDQVNPETADPANRLGYYDPNSTNDGRLYKYWFTLDGDEKFHAVTIFASKGDDSTIDRIQFEFGNYGSHVRVADIVAHFGDPASVGVDILAKGCRATLFYPEKHMWLTLERKKLRSSYEIKEDTLLSWSYFYTPAVWDEAMQHYTFPEEQIQPWTGYGKYLCKKTWQ